MTYKNINDLPNTIRKVLPEEAQEIYLEAYNQSWNDFDKETEPGMQDKETTAHRDGWAAVRQEFDHDEKKGIWYRKGEKPEETEEEQSLMDKVKDKVT